MSNPVADALGEFFDTIWGENVGYAYMPVKMVDTQRVRKLFVPWPNSRNAAVAHVLKWAADENAEVFFSPALYKSMDPSNENVLGAKVLWADFDGNAPTTWDSKVVPIPSVEVQSSTVRKRHVYWELDEFVTDRKVLEERNRAIAYALGADPSGWDANQFLRPPYSVNRKYDKPITAKIVEARQDRVYQPVAFADIPKPAVAIQQKIDLGTIPPIADVLALANWDRDMLEVFNRTGVEMSGPEHDRSGALQRLAYEGAEHGWTDEQIMSALLDADDRWGKYTQRATRERILVDLINRARAKHGYDPGDFDSLMLALSGRDGDPETISEDDEWVMSLDSIADMDDIQDWVIEDLLIPSGLGLITGRPGVGKTQAAFQVAADLATGRSEFLKWGITGTGVKVLFMSLEMSARQLRYLARPIRERYPEGLNNLLVWAKGDPLALDEKSGQHYFLSLIEKHRPDVVILDSLALAINGDLSDDKAVKPAFDFLKVMRNKFEFSMMMVHHHRKKANDAQSRKSPNTQSDIYGSYYITAQIDFALDFEQWGTDIELGEISVTLLKNRYSAPMDPFKVVRNDKLAFSVNEIPSGFLDV